MSITTRNPFNGETLGEYAESTLQDSIKLIGTVRATQKKWAVDMERRIEALEVAKENLRDHSKVLSTLVSTEMGKRISESENEVERCVSWIDYFIENGKRFLEPERVDIEGKEAQIRFPPLGTILLIMPWNAPVLQVMRAAIPALIAGNAVVLKHASAVTGTSLELQEIFDSDVFRSIVMRGNKVPQLFEHVDGISFTGSTETGATIASEAGRYLKKVVLELGGSDPFIVLRSADLQKAAKNATIGRMRINGQSCVASKCFIVASEIYQEFTELLANEFARLKLGDPLDRSTGLGPLADSSQKSKALEQLSRLGSTGEVVQYSNKEATGNFVPPTIVKTESRFSEEILAPIAVVCKFDTTEQAVQLANETPYGLGATIWGDREEAQSLLPNLEAGMIFVNSLIRGDARLPFGGVKKSGYGRELSRYGMLEFTNIQTVCWN